MLLVGAIHFEDKFVLAKKCDGEVGGHSHDMPWTYIAAALERPWSALSGPFLTLLSQIGTETTPSLL